MSSKQDIYIFLVRIVGVPKNNNYPELWPQVTLKLTDVFFLKWVCRYVYSVLSQLIFSLTSLVYLFTTLHSPLSHTSGPTLN